MLTPIARARRGLVAAHMGCAAAFGIMLSATPVCAQGYPGKTIKLVVPFGPGGPTDVSARLVSQVVQAALGQSVVIENRPGAGGATGTKSVAAAEPDGYTLLIGTSATLGVVPALDMFGPCAQQRLARLLALTEPTITQLVDSGRREASRKQDR